MLRRLWDFIVSTVREFQLHLEREVEEERNRRR
jgi:hypothetical protein